MSGRSVLDGVDVAGKKVLDIGCGNGLDLSHPYCCGAAELHGIDPDPSAIADGRAKFPAISLTQGYAESLPFPEAYFDVVMAIVSLPYTNIPRALEEISRVLRPGGTLLLLLHDWRLHIGFLLLAAREAAWKRVLDLGYVTLASAVYAACGLAIAKPSGSRETFQCAFRMRRQLRKTGFHSIRFEKRGRHFIAMATRT